MTSRAITAALPTPQRGLAMVVAAGVMAGALVGGIGGTPAHAATNNASYFISAINAQRVAHGRAKLAVDPTMMASAQRWANQMAKSNELYHNPRLATSVSNWKYLGENVGVGYSDSSLEGAFYASKPHRDNMLDKDFTQIGVQFAADGRQRDVDDRAVQEGDAGAEDRRQESEPAARLGQ